MPINPLKEFFKRKKAEVQFARAGPGKTLCADSSAGPSTSSEQSSARQAAAEAAMKRFNKDNTKPAQRPRMAPESKPAQTKPPPSEPKSSASAADQTPSVRKELPVVDGVPQRSIQIYSTEELAQRMKQPDLDDDFFRLTVEDAKLFKLRYDEERARNEILKTSEMRKREAEAKRPTTNFARLRFKLPNNMVLEASFAGAEPFSSIKQWLIETCPSEAGLKLESFDILFGLRLLKGTDLEKTVKELGLIPATTLTIVQKNNNT